MRRVFQIWLLVPEKWRFLIVGGWNTACSLLFFTVLFKFINNYKAALILSHLLSVTQSFAAFRILVFIKNSSRHIIQEYFKIHFLYALYFILNFILLWLIVEFTPLQPLVGQFIITCFLVILSYFGNKYFTFGDGKKRER